ncbi:MAG: response regulator [Elusimicrobia bacterium]|nr:response regulator [Elusimicrobiota bacterium]
MAQQRTILVVDDEADVRFVLKIALEKNGFEVVEAVDGADGFEKATAIAPDAIALDIMMPGLDGYTVNKKLKENPQTAKIPVVIITGKGQTSELMELRKNLQVAAYLEKPFPVSILIEKLKEIFS